MVVIVIMGILAAVAVPKLFGMIAKSKASEVPTAAGTWINMVEAYAQEAYAAGDWNQIGYTAPGKKLASGTFESNEFHYEGGLGSSTAEGKWKAQNIHKLDDCTAGSWGWELTATVQGSGSTAAGEVSVTVGTGVAECMGLTTSFAKLAK